MGHGTHVAAMLGGRTFGLAKLVNIYPVRALCTTYNTGHIKQALDLVAQVHSPFQPTAVVNISGLNGLEDCEYNPDDDECDHQIFEAIIELAKRDNIFIVQSAGNQSFVGSSGRVDACVRTFGDEAIFDGVTPEEIANRVAVSRIVVAAGSDEFDGLWRWETGDYGSSMGSNVGRCVDVFAPAAHIVSAFFPYEADEEDADQAVCQLSGTSMAAPQVSGVAAMILSVTPNICPEGLKAAILRSAERGVLETNSADPNYIGAGSPNLLVHWDPNIVMLDGFECADLSAW